MFFGKRRLETPSRQFMPFAANGPYQPDLAARMRAGPITDYGIYTQNTNPQKKGGIKCNDSDP